MLEIILSIVSLISIVIIGIVLYFIYKNLNDKVSDRMSNIVDQINNTHKYEFDFDTHQNENIKNIDYNVTTTYKNLLNLQNNVKYLENTYVPRDELVNGIQTNNLNTATINIANNTSSNNIIFEAGRSTDNNNIGFSAINFNGYYDKEDKIIDKNKSRWRIYADQTSNNDSFSIDQYDGTNLNKYIWMNNDIISLNNDTTRILNGSSNINFNSSTMSHIVNDNDHLKQLLIVGNKSADNSNFNVGIVDNLGVYGDSTFLGNASVAGKFCIGNTCITESNLKKVLAL